MRPNSGFWSTNTLILSPTHLQSETIKFLVNKPREHHEQRCFPFHKSVFRTSFQSRPLFSAPFRRLRAWPLSREEKQGFDFHDIGQQTTRNRERGRATLGERREKVPTRSEKNTHPVPFPFCSRGKFPSRVRKKEAKAHTLPDFFVHSPVFWVCCTTRYPCWWEPPAKRMGQLAT